MTDIREKIKQLNDQSRLIYLCKNDLPFTEFRKFALKEINNALEDYRTTLLKEIEEAKMDTPKDNPLAQYAEREKMGFNAGLDKTSSIIRGDKI